jgi:hypothetical protein
MKTVLTFKNALRWTISVSFWENRVNSRTKLREFAGVDSKKLAEAIFENWHGWAA